MSKCLLGDVPLNSKIKPETNGLPSNVSIWLIAKTNELYTTYSIENGLPKAKDISYYDILGFSDFGGAYDMRHFHSHNTQKSITKLADKQIIDACATFSYYYRNALVEVATYNKGQKCSVCSINLEHCDFQNNAMCDFCKIMQSI